MNINFRKRRVFITLVIMAALASLPLLAAAESVNLTGQMQEKRFSEMERQLFAASDSQPQGQEYPKRLETIISKEAKVEKEEGAGHSAESYFRYLPKVDAHRQAGGVDVLNAAAEYDYKFKAFGKLPIELSLVQDYISLANTTVVRVPTHLIGLSFGIETTLPFFFKNTYMRLGANPGTFADSWDFRTSAFRMPFQAIAIHQPNDKLTLIAGLAAFIDYEDELFPVFGFIYQPNDKWTFNITPKRPTISYALNDKITLFGEGDFSFGEYEVDKSSDHKSVILQYKEAYAGAGVGYDLNKYINISLSAGGAFNRALRYRDRSLGKIIIKNGFYSEFRVQTEF